MENILLMLQVLLANWYTALTGGVILACLVIFIMGVAKKAGLGKIKNKHLKKAILYFGSIVMVLPTTAFYFLIDGINFRWYWWACLFTSILTTITYCLYENSGVRAIVHFVGEKTVGKWFGVLWIAFKEKWDNKTTVNHLSMTTAELREEVRRDLQGHIKIKEDLDLTDL